MPGYLKIIAGIALLPVALILVIAIYLALFTTPVSLNFLKDPIQKKVQDQLGWLFEIRGDVYLVPALKPSLEVREVAIADPASRDDELFFARRMYLDLDLLALLDRNFEIGEISVSDLQIALRIDRHGSPNWQLSNAAVEAGQPDSDSRRESAGTDSFFDFFDLHKVTFNLTRARFENISFSYQDQIRNTRFTAAIENGLASIRWNDPMTLSLIGHSNDVPVTLELEASAFSSLLDLQRDWEGRINLVVGKVDMAFAAALRANPGSDSRAPTLQLELRGDSLQEVTELLEIPLPPWGPYHLGGKLGLTDTGYYLEKVALGVGQSNLSGEITLDLPNEHPNIAARLHSRLIDTRDFELGDWEGFEFDAVDNSAKGPDQRHGESLLDPGILQTFGLDVDIVFDEIKSGTDELGKGSLDLLVSDGRIGVEDFEASIPGGLVKARMMLMPGYDKISASIFIETKEFDYGILARRAVPDSSNKGRLFLDVDITAESDSLETLLASANGKIGLAVWPENFESGAFDLWAVDLLNAAATRYGDPSLVNCVVARFSIRDGLMEQDAILIDTSEIRVIGDGTVDFRNQTVDFYLVPKAKKRALVSIAVPAGVKGSFDEFELAVKSDDVFKSIFRNTANIVFLGLPLLFHKPLEQDGTAACEDAMVNDIDLTIRPQPADTDTSD